MAAVGLDMEKKEELAEHSLEGDFQFIPTELTMSKSAQVMWNYFWFISVSNVNDLHVVVTCDNVTCSEVGLWGVHIGKWKRSVKLCCVRPAKKSFKVLCLLHISSFLNILIFDIYDFWNMCPRQLQRLGVFSLHASQQFLRPAVLSLWKVSWVPTYF